jgi:predicted XRE-type DNA-binding protein
MNIRNNMKKDIIESSGNVFADLGYPPDEAAILQMRADLMANLRTFIKTKKLAQTEAAKIHSIPIIFPPSMGGIEGG